MKLPIATAPLSWYLLCTFLWSSLACMLVVAAGVITGNVVDSTAPLALSVGLIMEYLLISRRIRHN